MLPETPFSLKLSATVLDCKDVIALSEFYLRFLNWKKAYSVEDQWLAIADPSGSGTIAFQKNEDYIPPVWPEQKNQQQQMEHLDFAVENKEQMKLAVQHAIQCGASVAGEQFSEEWTVMIDPAGHPFCIVL